VCWAASPSPPANPPSKNMRVYFSALPSLPVILSYICSVVNDLVTLVRGGLSGLFFLRFLLLFPLLWCLLGVLGLLLRID